MRWLARLLVAAAVVVCPTVGLAADPTTADPPKPTISSSIPDLHLSIGDVPGETTLRLPLASESHLLYGLLNPYLSLGTNTTLGVPGVSSLSPVLRRDPDGLDDVRLGAGFALPLSGRTQVYGEYRFLRGRVDSGVGRGLLQRDPESGDIRAGFSIRLD